MTTTVSMLDFRGSLPGALAQPAASIATPQRRAAARRSGVGRNGTGFIGKTLSGEGRGNTGPRWESHLMTPHLWRAILLARVTSSPTRVRAKPHAGPPRMHGGPTSGFGFVSAD